MTLHIPWKHGRTLAVLPAVLLLMACGGGVASLVGDYSTTENGQADLRITRSGADYLMSAKVTSPQWSEPEKVTECTDDVYRTVFGLGWRDLAPHGLCAAEGAFGIYRVKKGATGQEADQAHTFKTGYFAFLLLGGDDVYRR